MRSRTGGVRLVVAVGVFVASLALFDRVFFAAFQQARPSPDTRSALRQKLENLSGSNYQLLVLGTSRTFEAVHPALIAHALGIKSYKEAFQGKGPRYNYEFYQLYEQIVGRPRWVVYGLDYFIFNIVSEEWAMGRFAKGTATTEDAVERGPLLMLANKRTDDRAIIRALEHLQQRWLPPVGQFDPERNVRDMEAYTGNTVSKVSARETPTSYERVPFVPFPGREGQYLTRLLQQWADEGVAVLLIDTPDYIATYQTNFERDRFVEAVNALVGNRSNCVFINYSDPRRFPLQEAAYFVDGEYGNPNSHLARPGVVQFNRLFLADLRRFVSEHPGH